MSDAADTDSPSSPSSPSSSATTSAGDGDAPPVNDHKAYLTQKRTEFLNHMLRSIDIITYLHLTYLYLLEYLPSLPPSLSPPSRANTPHSCSFIRFALRSSTQFLFLTPKILTFPLPPHQRSPIIALLGSTAFCVLEHLWEANPAAGELTHGYQHGGLIVDFIGQGMSLPPRSKSMLTEGKQRGRYRNGGYSTLTPRCCCYSS